MVDAEAPPRGSLNLTQDSYIEAIVIAGGDAGNYMATIWKPKPDERLLITDRLRIYRDDKVFESADEKASQTFECPNDMGEEVALHFATQKAALMALAFRGQVHVVVVRGNYERLLECIKENPHVSEWLHVKVEPQPGRA